VIASASASTKKLDQADPIREFARRCDELREQQNAGWRRFFPRRSAKESATGAGCAPERRKRRQRARQQARGRPNLLELAIQAYACEPRAVVGISDALEVFRRHRADVKGDRCVYGYLR
jgi:hypothetical protein